MGRIIHKGLETTFYDNLRIIMKGFFLGLLLFFFRLVENIKFWKLLRPLDGKGTISQNLVILLTFLFEPVN